MRAWKSGIWSLSGQAINLFVTLTSLAILGRLLTPQDFGLFGLVLAVQSFIAPLLDMGLLPAYLKVEGSDKQASDAFFTVNVFVGCLIAGLLVLFAPWLALLYTTEQLTSLFAVFSISIVINSLAAQPVAVLSRDKRFDKLFFVQTSALVFSTILAVGLALLGFGVWALVWRAVCTSVVRFGVLYLLSDRKYKLVRISAIKPFIPDLKFGVEIFFSRLLSGWANSLDKLVLAKFITLSELGGYTKSQQLSLMPDSLIRTALTTPALSYLARIQSKSKVEDYLLLYGVVFLLAGVPCLVITAYGDIILPLVLGNQWEGVGWMLQWMGLYGLARVLYGLMVVYNIDRATVHRTSLAVIGSIFGVLMLPFILLFTTENLNYFILSTGIMSIIYWFGALLYTTLRDNVCATYRIVKVLLSFIIISLVSVLVTMEFFPPPSAINIILGIFSIVIISCSLFTVFNFDIAKRLYLMIRRKDESNS